MLLTKNDKKNISKTLDIKIKYLYSLFLKGNF